MDLVNLALVQKAVRDAHVDHIGPPGPKGDKGDKGDPLTWDDLTEEQKASLKGADGVSPTVSTSKSGNVTTITIVDVAGTKTATINDGDTGPKGDTGPQGPAGADGYTPVKGTDYFTESDKTELVNAVLAALPAAEGVSY